MLWRSKQERAQFPRWGREATPVTFASRLVFEHVTRRFGDTLALDDFSLEIEPGEIVCLLGPSGCGKTTALRLAAGVDHPSAGRILLDAAEMSGPSAFVPPERRGIGLMFQDFALFPHLTILENVGFGLRDLGRKEARREAAVALERVALDHYADEYPHILSGGEQQRVALARAIAPRPNVLLMDEPFSGLDPQLREAMREETHAILREMRATCLIVTHAPEEAMRMGDRIAIMRRGRLVQAGTAKALYREPANIEVARTFSEMNEFSARVTSGRVVTPLGTFPADRMEDEADVVVCVRQRGMRLNPDGSGPARVVDVRFLGDSALVELRLENWDQPILARVHDGEAPEKGTSVSVAVIPGAVLTFPVAESA